MKEYKFVFVDTEMYPEIKKFPKCILLEDRPIIGDVIEIGDHRFRVTEVILRPTVANINYKQFHEPAIILVEYN